MECIMVTIIPSKQKCLGWDTKARKYLYELSLVTINGSTNKS